MKQVKLNFRIKVIVNGKTTTDSLTHQKRRFLRKIRTINFQNGQMVYIRINYGVLKDNFGKSTNFYNDGYYDNYRDLIRAAEAFTEL